MENNVFIKWTKLFKRCACQALVCTVLLCGGGGGRDGGGGSGGRSDQWLLALATAPPGITPPRSASSLLDSY